METMHQNAIGLPTVDVWEPGQLLFMPYRAIFPDLRDRFEQNLSQVADQEFARGSG